MSALTAKQQKFIDAYFACGLNATKAAIVAGYPEKSARSIGHENLTKPDIRAEVDRRMAESAMSANEVLARLANHARGDMAEFITIVDVPATETIPAQRYVKLDLVGAADAGKLHLVKSYSVTETGYRFELYDAQAALSLLGKAHRLFVDRTEHSGKIDVTKLSDDELAALITE